MFDIFTSAMGPCSSSSDSKHTTYPNWKHSLLEKMDYMGLLLCPVTRAAHLEAIAWSWRRRMHPKSIWISQVGRGFSGTARPFWYPTVSKGNNMEEHCLCDPKPGAESGSPRPSLFCRSIFEASTPAHSETCSLGLRPIISSTGQGRSWEIIHLTFWTFLKNLKDLEVHNIFPKAWNLCLLM